MIVLTLYQLSSWLSRDVRLVHILWKPEKSCKSKSIQALAPCDCVKYLCQGMQHVVAGTLRFHKTNNPEFCMQHWSAHTTAIWLTPPHMCDLPWTVNASRMSCPQVLGFRETQDVLQGSPFETASLSVNLRSIRFITPQMKRHKLLCCPSTADKGFVEFHFYCDLLSVRCTEKWMTCVHHMISAAVDIINRSESSMRRWGWVIVLKHLQLWFGVWEFQGSRPASRSCADARLISTLVSSHERQDERSPAYRLIVDPDNADHFLLVPHAVETALSEKRCSDKHKSHDVVVVLLSFQNRVSAKARKRQGRRMGSCGRAAAAPVKQHGNMFHQSGCFNRWQISTRTLHHLKQCCGVKWTGHDPIFDTFIQVCTTLSTLSSGSRSPRWICQHQQSAGVSTDVSFFTLASTTINSTFDLWLEDTALARSSHFLDAFPILFPRWANLRCTVKQKLSCTKGHCTNVIVNQQCSSSSSPEQMTLDRRLISICCRSRSWMFEVKHNIPTPQNHNRLTDGRLRFWLQHEWDHFPRYAITPLTVVWPSSAPFHPLQLARCLCRIPVHMMIYSRILSGCNAEDQTRCLFSASQQWNCSMDCNKKDTIHCLRL